MDRNISWYQGLARELEWDFRPRNNLFQKIDDMVRPSWSLPQSFTETVKNVMAIVDAAPSDAIHSGAIAFSSTNPIFSVTPFMPNIAEYDRAQGLEDNLSWHFKRANKRGNGTMMYDLAVSTLKYNTACVRVDDLCHIFPRNKNKWTPLQKRAWTQGRFINKVVNPKNVYYAETDLGVTTVVHVESFRVLDTIKYWELYANSSTPEGTMVQEALNQLKQDIGYGQGTGDKLRETYFIQTYCIDDDRLMIWGSVIGNISTSVLLGGDTNISVPKYVFADQPNPYGFIPWSIRVAGDRLESKMEYKVNPLLAPLYWSGSWDKLNLARSIIFSEPIRRAQTPRMATFTDSGDAPEIDYENGGDINLRRGEDVKGLQPITLDQGALAIVQQLSTEMNRTTGASMIGDTTQISSRTTFATFAAMVKMALSRLDIQLGNMARSAEDVATLFLSWVDKTNIPLTAYAGATTQYRSGTVVPVGMKIETNKSDYDLQSLGISVEIRAKTPVDEMEQLNRAVILSTKLNVPSSKLLEELGYDNVAPMYELWAQEFLKNAEVQAQAAKLMAQAQGEGQLAVQQEAQQAQQEAQQAQGAEQGISNQSFGMLGGLGNGVNPAMQGMAPEVAAPGVGRNQITGANFGQRGGG